MPRAQSQRLQDSSSHSAISQIHGTLFMLSIISDEDDAATLRADLKRSRLKDYKLQRCRSIDEGINLLKACCFDLIFINLGEFENIENTVTKLRQIGFDNPILGLASRRSIDVVGFQRPDSIDDVLCKEDMSPSLVEHVIKATLEKHLLATERKLLKDRLHLALNAGELGTWTYFPNEGQFELGSVCRELLGIPSPIALQSLEDVLEAVYPEDRKKLRELLEGADNFEQDVRTQFRLNASSMPLPIVELRGQVLPGNVTEMPAVIGVVRRLSQANDLFERIVEANTEIEEALKAREEILSKANRKLQALASELNPADSAAPEEKTSQAEASKIEIDESKLLIRPKKPTSEKSAEKAPAPVQRKESKETPVSSAKPKKPGRPKKKTDDAKSSEDSSLLINKKTAFQEVLKSITRSKKEKPEKQGFLFDFSKEPISELSLPDPSKDGFTVAAKRLVAMTRKGHGLDVTLSLADQQAIEMEDEKELLYDVLKELITNVVKHAKATICIVSLFRDEDEWVLQVEDDGVGLDEKLKSVSAPLHKIGLFRIRTQLALKGGHLDMAPAMPKGLVARARLPVNTRNSADLR